MAHLPLLTVSVPVALQEAIANSQVYIIMYSCSYVHYIVCTLCRLPDSENLFNLQVRWLHLNHQAVHRLARMEEHVWSFHYDQRFHVIVLQGTQDGIVRKQVGVQQGVHYMLNKYNHNLQ